MFAGTVFADIEPMARRTNSDSEATVAAIQGAATHLFLNCGYAATTIRQIAHHAGVSPGLIHHYFDSKETLFVEAVVRRHHGRVLDTMERAAACIDGPGPVEERIRRAATIAIKFIQSSRETMRLVAAFRCDVGQTPEALRRHHAMVFSPDTLAPLAARLGVPYQDFLHLAFHIDSMVSRIALLDDEELMTLTQTNDVESALQTVAGQIAEIVERMVVSAAAE